MNPPLIQGGGLVCALGTHPGTALTALAADLRGLEPLHVPEIQSKPIIIGRVRGSDPTDPSRHVMALLLDAIDRSATSAARPPGDEIAVIVGWPDPERPGAPPRPSLAALADRIGAQLGIQLDSERVRCLTGETSGARALAAAAQMLATEPLDACLVVAADSWLTQDSLRWLTERTVLRWRILADGMVPAEAGAALWLIPSSKLTPGVHLAGVGSTVGSSSSSTRSVGHAIGHALTQAKINVKAVDHLVVDPGADVWGLLRCSLAMSRASEMRWAGTTWIPANALGHVGAATGLVSVLIASHVLTRYSEGGIGLCVTSSSEDGDVAAVLTMERGPEASAEEPIQWAL